jgi:hypothetical protein
VVQSVVCVVEKEKSCFSRASDAFPGNVQWRSEREDQDNTVEVVRHFRHTRFSSERSRKLNGRMDSSRRNSETPLLEQLEQRE